MVIANKIQMKVHKLIQSSCFFVIMSILVQSSIRKTHTHTYAKQFQMLPFCTKIKLKNILLLVLVILFVFGFLHALIF